MNKNFLIINVCSLFLFQFSLAAQDLKEVIEIQNPFIIKKLTSECSKTNLNLLCKAYSHTGFDNLSKIENDLEQWITKPTNIDFIVDAKVKLASVLILQGKFEPAVKLYKEIYNLPLSKQAKEKLKNAIDLFGGFKGTGETKVFIKKGLIPVKFDTYGLPTVEIKNENEINANTIIDTGANISTISKSVASKLGLKIIKGSVKVTNVIGNEVNANLAVAEHLIIGKNDLYNIPFIVLNDNDLNFKKDYSIEMILGLPVLIKFGRLEIYNDGHIFVDNKIRKSREPNLFFDQFSLALNASINKNPIYLFIDTGAAKSNMNKGFKEVVENIYDSLNPKKSTANIGGVGGNQTFDVIDLEDVNINISGKNVKLKKTFIKPELLNQGHLQGSLGNDVLGKTGKGMVLDFNNMRLELL